MMTPIWNKTPPTVQDLDGCSEEYFWARGGNFNRPIMVRANNGVNSEIVDGKRQYHAEINFEFFSDGCSAPIWSCDLHRWPGLGQLEWAGPVERPTEDCAGLISHGEGKSC